MLTRLAAIVGSLLLLVTGCPGAQDAWAPAQTDVRIPMRDGQALAADVWLPAAPGRYPAVLIQTPYNRRGFRSVLQSRGERGIFDLEHYAFVVLDWRGFHGSKGAQVTGSRPRYGQDGFDAVEWIAAQSWSDGRVGTWGPSALGRVQFMTAVERPPHLVCCVPLVAAAGYSYDEFYADGLLREAHVNDLERLGFGALTSALALGDPTLVCRVLSRLPDRIERINVPAFVITGWYDISVPQELRTFEALRGRAGEVAQANSKMLVGPWHHTAVGRAAQGALRYDGAEGESDRMARLFLDYWLRDRKDNGWADVALLRWWQMGEAGWLTANDPPGPKTTPASLYLHADGLLSAEKPRTGEPSRTYVSNPTNPVPTIGGANLPSVSPRDPQPGPQDQRELEARDDVLVYTTGVVREPLRLFGSVTLTLSFAVDQRDATFAARLCEVHPDGRSMLICDGATRAKYRSGPERALSVSPGQTYEATVLLPPTAITIATGHRLRVSVAGSKYPRFQLNDHSGEDAFHLERAVPVTCTISHDPTHPSTLSVPILP